MKRLAVLILTKLDTLFQETLRRLYNVSQRQSWKERATHLSDFVRTMFVSGYSEEERYNTIKGAIIRWEEMINRVNSGEMESLNRSRKQILDSKVSRKVWPNTWYLKGLIISTLNCVVTPGSRLKSMLSKSINDSNKEQNRVLIIEDGGLPITKGLKVGDPGRTSLW